MTREQSIQLLGYRDNLHVAHWQAPRKTNEHATLGELYESILPLIDALTELSLVDGNLEFPEINIVILNRVTYEDLVLAGLYLLTEIRSTFTPGKDDDALNIIADICAAIRRAAYKLEVVTK